MHTAQGSNSILCSIFDQRFSNIISVILTTCWQNNPQYKIVCSRKFSFRLDMFQPASLFIFSKSQILAEKSQSLNEGEKPGPVKTLLVIYKICWMTLFLAIVFIKYSREEVLILQVQFTEERACAINVFEKKNISSLSQLCAAITTNFAGYCIFSPLHSKSPRSARACWIVVHCLICRSLISINSFFEWNTLDSCILLLTPLILLAGLW